MCLYVHESVPVISHSCAESIEFLSAIIRSSEGSLLVAINYQPPGSDASLEELEKVLQGLGSAVHEHVVST